MRKLILFVSVISVFSCKQKEVTKTKSELASEHENRLTASADSVYLSQTFKLYDKWKPLVGWDSLRYTYQLTDVLKQDTSKLIALTGVVQNIIERNGQTFFVSWQDSETENSSFNYIGFIKIPNEIKSSFLSNFKHFKIDDDVDGKFIVRVDTVKTYYPNLTSASIGSSSDGGCDSEIRVSQTWSTIRLEGTLVDFILRMPDQHYEK